MGGTSPTRPKTVTPQSGDFACLEAGEVLEHYQWGDESADKEALAGELADVALYLLQLAHVEGIDLEQAILDTIARNWNRQWSDEKDVEK